MKSRRLAVLFISIIFFSCTTPPAKMEEVKPPAAVKENNIEKLEKFFKRSELDSIKAAKVLQKHRTIQHLTHLRKMDTGGKKYYLLEKDEITEMINSVTEGIYLDYILINRHGDIVYTRKNEELFGANINTGFDNSPLLKCFVNRNGVFFEDVSLLSQSSKIYSLYVSSSVYVEDSFHGVLVLMVEIKKISEAIDTGIEIFSSDGVIRVTSDEERIFQKYNGIEKIDMKDLDARGELLFDNTPGKVRFSKFGFKSIDWILMNREL